MRFLSLCYVCIFVDTCLRGIKSNFVTAVNGGLKLFSAVSISGRYTEAVKERGDDTLVFMSRERCNFVSATLSNVSRMNRAHLALAAEFPEELLVLELAPLIRDHPRHLEGDLINFVNCIYLNFQKE